MEPDHLHSLEIKRLLASELSAFRSLIDLFEEVFEMTGFLKPADQHLAKLLSRNDFFVFVATLNKKVVRGLTAYVLEQYYSTRPLAYIFDLAVATEHQRKVIGKQLIAETTHFFREQGYEEMFVQADKADTHALDFYRSTGHSQEEQVIHFYYLLNK